MRLRVSTPPPVSRYSSYTRSSIVLDAAPLRPSATTVSATTPMSMSSMTPRRTSTVGRLQRDPCCVTKRKQDILNLFKAATKYTKPAGLCGYEYINTTTSITPFILYPIQYRPFPPGCCYPSSDHQNVLQNPLLHDYR